MCCARARIHWIPEIKGLENAGYLTAHTLFELKTIPESLAIIGSDSFGLEAAQAFARLGCKVSLIVQSSHLLPIFDPELTILLAKILTEEGVELHLGVEVERVKKEGRLRLLFIRQRVGDSAKTNLCHGNASLLATVDQILIATGSIPNLEDLNLQKANVKVTKEGVRVDEFLHT